MAESDNLLRERILASARAEFYRRGFSRVTVDDIVASLGISKKTFYKYFESKDQLIRVVTEDTIAQMSHACVEITKQTNVEFVDKLREMMTLVGVVYAQMGQQLIEDLQKHTPEIWKLIERHRRESIERDFGSLLREGMQKGMFRHDIDEQLVLLIYTNIVESIINPSTLMNLPFTAVQAFEAVIKIIYEGILTDEARPKFQSGVASMADQRV
jgi:AcrR family transcriptional regulator